MGFVIFFYKVKDIVLCWVINSVFVEGKDHPCHEIVAFDLSRK